MLSTDTLKRRIFKTSLLRAYFRTQEIEVSYEAVDKAVEGIWADNPMLVVHCGVAGRRKEICIETRARNGPYNKKDVLDKFLPGEFITGPGQ